MEMKEIWESMGFLDEFNDNEEKEKLVSLYSDLCEYIDDGILEEIEETTYIKEWWNSYLPMTDEEWGKYVDDSDDDPISIEEFKKVYQYDKTTFITIAFDVLKEMYKQNYNIDFERFIDCLDMITMEPLINYDDLNRKLSFGELYMVAVEAIKEQCFTFYEIIDLIDFQ